MSRLAKTSKYNKNRNQSSFSARVLGGRSWPQMKTLQVLWGRKTATQKEHKRHVFTLSMQAFPLFSSFSNLKVKEGQERGISFYVGEMSLFNSSFFLVLQGNTEPNVFPSLEGAQEYSINTSVC